MDVFTKEDLDAAYDHQKRPVIGAGTFGHVQIVKHRETKEKFAMKTMHKREDEPDTDEYFANLIRKEKMCMEHLDHPFIVKLLATYEGDISVYFILEYVKLGDLFDFVCKYHAFAVTNVRFYSAELVSALEYLRIKGIVHRDIKTENILVAESFHIKLTDFGFAEKIANDRGEIITRMKNIHCGTPDLWAPEVCFMEPITFSTDLWNLAGIISDLYSGRWVCQRLETESHYMWYQRIEMGLYEFPQPNPDAALKDLFKRLLKRNPEFRIGAINMEELKGHRFFTGISWDDLPNMTPPRLERGLGKKTPKFKMKDFGPQPGQFQAHVPESHQNIPKRIFPMPRRKIQLTSPLLRREEQNLDTGSPFSLGGASSGLRRSGRLACLADFAESQTQGAYAGASTGQLAGVSSDTMGFNPSVGERASGLRKSGRQSGLFMLASEDAEGFSPSLGERASGLRRSGRLGNLSTLDSVSERQGVSEDAEGFSPSLGERESSLRRSGRQNNLSKMDFVSETQRASDDDNGFSPSLGERTSGLRRSDRLANLSMLDFASETQGASTGAKGYASSFGGVAAALRKSGREKKTAAMFAASSTLQGASARPSSAASTEVKASRSRTDWLADKFRTVFRKKSRMKVAPTTEGEWGEEGEVKEGDGHDQYEASKAPHFFASQMEWAKERARQRRERKEREEQEEPAQHSDSD